MTYYYIALGLYFLTLFLIGVFASKRIKNLDDYYVGGKNLGYWVVAFSARATGESAWLLLGLTGMGAMMGVSAFWVVVGEMLGVGLAWFTMAKPFKHRSDSYKSITIPDYLVSRFGSKTHLLRMISATALSLFVIIYVSAQIDATGSAFERFLGWDYYWGAIAGFSIVVLYIFSGGFVAVAWSDLFQGLLMFAGLVFLPLVALYSIGNFTDIVQGLEQIDPALLSVWGDGGLTLMNIMTIGGFAMIGLGFLGSPQVFVRFMSIKNENEINKGRWVALVFTLLTDAGAVAIGILGRYLYTSAGQDPTAVLGNGAQNVLITMVEALMPPLLIGLFIAVVLSAIMSTIDSLLVVASSAVTRDFYQKIYHPERKNKDLTRLSRIVTLAMAVFALCIAMVVAVLTPERTIFWFVIFGWSGIAATFCPVMILSLFWEEYSEKGAIASMITGFLCVPIFKFGVANMAVIGPYFEQLAELGPSFAVSMLVGVIVTKLTAKKPVTG